MSSEPSAPAPRSVYWRRTLHLSAVLLALWLVLTLGVSLFAQSLDVVFFGWPFGFWITAQGALIIFCAIVWYYAWAMDRLDQDHGARSGD